MTTKEYYPIPAHLHDGRFIFCALHPYERERPGDRPYERFRKPVKWPHSDRSWLSAKLGCEPGDSKLDAKAIRAAFRGELIVYVDMEGQLADFGSPRRRKEAR
jgi:hypothetical protein